MKLVGYEKYYEAVKYLESLNNISGSYQKTNLASHPRPDMYLERMQDFLNKIGNPEKGFKYVHITGTAGKGSVSSIIQTTLVNKNKRTGLFTSPFVTSTIEKIKVNDRYIDPNVFAEIVEFLKPHIDNLLIYGRHGMPSYFEIIFAIALIYFKKERCEYIVLEVGLGGRYDATNIIKKPLITAITNIGLDHTQILGATTDKIALDKAGIIKKTSHFFTTEEDDNLLNIFKNECKKNKAIYNQCSVEGLNYQEKNRLLASSICIDLGIIKKYEDISIPAIFPARFEIITQNPTIIIDGAHNVSKIQSTVFNLEKIKYSKLNVLIAISSDKDWKKMLEIILPKTDKLFVTRFSVNGRACVNPKEIIEFSKKYISKNKIFFNSDPTQAFNNAKKVLTKKDVLLITGSFYLAGDIRKIYCSEDKILKQRNSIIS
jgi:dihydrofolate synthase/folylpolyglutamate synthase